MVLSVNLNLIIIIAKKKCYEFYIRPDENCRSNVKAFLAMDGPILNINRIMNFTRILRGVKLSEANERKNVVRSFTKNICTCAFRLGILC